MESGIVVVRGVDYDNHNKLAPLTKKWIWPPDATLLLDFEALTRSDIFVRRLACSRAHRMIAVEHLRGMSRAQA